MAEHIALDRPSQSVMVDIGGGFGALVVNLPQRLLGAEIEISPRGEPENRQHVAVLPRQLGSRRSAAALFPRLAAGEYRLWLKGGRQIGTAHIDDGKVSALELDPGHAQDGGSELDRAGVPTPVQSARRV